MEEQKINKKITIGVVAVLLIVLITIGATYAYFSAQGTTGTQTVTTGTLTMGFDKIGSVVTINGITPINDNEIKTKAAAFPFSITNTGTAHMNITIKLKDIVIADDLKDVDFRWGLYNADTDKGISFGIFKYATNGGEEIIYRDSIIDAGAPTKNYILRIWIHDDGAEQNYMQGETFSAKIDVTGTAVQYTPESCFYFDETTGTISAFDSSWNQFYDVETCGTDLVIPKTIDNVAVTTIGYSAFFAMDLTSVIIPDTVVDLEMSAFYDCKNIKHLTIPESVTTIGSDGISGINLESIFITENLTQLNSSIGNTGANLKTLVVPGNIEFVIDARASHVILMEGVTTIGMATFYRSQFTSIEIPSSVTNIMVGTSALDAPFNESTNLETIVVRGKTSAPSGFGEDWNCIEYSMATNSCTKYANVEYRP